jgi:hypothetical protein
MSLSGQAATAMIAFAPVVAFFAYAIVKAQRKKRAQDQATEPEPPFDSAPEPPPGAWLGHFDAAERTFLRRQFPTVRTCFLVNAWFFAVMLSSGLLPQYVDLAANGQSLAQRVWYSYLQHFSSGSFVCSIVALVSALIAISPLLIPAQASFQRNTAPASRIPALVACAAHPGCTGCLIPGSGGLLDPPAAGPARPGLEAPARRQSGRRGNLAIC